MVSVDLIDVFAVHVSVAEAARSAVRFRPAAVRVAGRLAGVAGT
jgi:hypothetical protein